MYLTQAQVNVVSAAIASYRVKLAGRATRQLVRGNDRNVQRLLADVEMIDNLQASVAEHGQNICIGPPVYADQYRPREMTAWAEREDHGPVDDSIADDVIEHHYSLAAVTELLNAPTAIEASHD